MGSHWPKRQGMEKITAHGLAKISFHGDVKEIALALFIGKVELSFVLPVEMLFNKIAELTKRIKQAPDKL